MVERSAGAVVFYKGENGPEYLLLRHDPLNPPIGAGGTKEYWNFPKGRIEKGEKSEATAVREIAEETGLGAVSIAPGFKETERYVYVLKGEKIYKWVAWFLAESKTKKVKISFEHVDSGWFSYDEALQKVTYGASKKLLTKAHQFLCLKLDTP